jgi:hypothetical protein
MGLWGKFSSQDPLVRAAIITGIFGIIGAVITVTLTNASQPPTKSPGASSGGPLTLTTSASIVSSTTSTPDCPKRLQITAPNSGKEVVGTTGVEITGVACGLEPGQAAWIFEQDPYDQNYYLVYDPNVGPRAVTSQDGPFAIEDQPIGDPGDHLKQYLIVAVLASAQCSNSINDKPSDNAGNYVFQSFPSGCQIIDHVQILESQP